ncbi:MAG: arginase [Paludibacteraceae bacterium]|nr:arginase [Paludibacteraceae bacterium]
MMTKSHVPISFVKAATFNCGNGHGTEQAPNSLYDKLHIKSDIKTIIPALSSEKTSFNEKVEELMEVALLLKKYVESELRSSHSVCVLGGDHSIALGSVAGTLLYDDNAAVIWFDAHGDINTEISSPSGHIHGMPVAALLGLCSSALNGIPTHYLKTENIFWIGVRDLDPGEREIANKLNLNMYSAEYVHRVGMAKVMNEISMIIKQQNCKTLHLSFDIDGMDPSVVSATGTAVPNGLLQADFEIFVKELSFLKHSADVEFRILDFVEYNPLLDKDGNTLEWCSEALKSLLEQMV